MRRFLLGTLSFLLCLRNGVSMLTVDGQTILNSLRHTSILSGAPDESFRSASLVTHVLQGPWKEVVGNIPNEFFMLANARAGRSWQLATYNMVGNNEVTFHVAISCVDRGSVRGDPAGFVVGPKLEVEVDARIGRGKRVGNGEDIVAQCMQGTLTLPNDLEFRVAQHIGEHRDSGDGFLVREVAKDITREKLKKLHDDIVSGYGDQSLSDPDEIRKMTVARGLTYTTGMIVVTPRNQSTEIEANVSGRERQRVSLLQSVAIEKHNAQVLGTRPAEDVVNRELASGTAAKVTTYVAALVIESWLLWTALQKYFRQMRTEWKEMSELQRQKDVIRSLRREMLAPLTFVLIVILTAIPFLVELIIGDINPSSRATMISGFTTTQGVIQEDLSEQPSNLYAGTPFVVTGFVTLQGDSQGHRIAIIVPIAIGGLAFLVVSCLMIWEPFNYPEIALLYDRHAKAKVQTWVMRHLHWHLLARQVEERATPGDTANKERKEALKCLMQWPIPREWLKKASHTGRMKELADMSYRFDLPTDELLLGGPAEDVPDEPKED